MKISKFIDFFIETQNKLETMDNSTLKMAHKKKFAKDVRKALMRNPFVIGECDDKQIAFVFDSNRECERFIKDNFMRSFRRAGFKEFLKMICNGQLSVDNFRYDKDLNKLFYVAE